MPIMFKMDNQFKIVESSINYLVDKNFQSIIVNSDIKEIFNRQNKNFFNYVLNFNLGNENKVYHCSFAKGDTIFCFAHRLDDENRPRFEAFAKMFFNSFFFFNKTKKVLEYFIKDGEEIRYDLPYENIIGEDNHFKIDGKCFEYVKLKIKEFLFGEDCYCFSFYSYYFSEEGNQFFIEKFNTYVNEDNEQYVCGYIRLIDKVISKNFSFEFMKKTDGLTGLLDKDGIKEYALNELKIKQDYEAVFGLIDIDCFRNINDNYGLAFGDKVLCEVANQIKYIVEYYKGKVGRMDKDIFLFFVPMSTNDERKIKDFLRLIKEKIKQLFFSELPNFFLTTTIGASCYPNDGSDIDSVLKCANKALIHGKNKGKDCYILFNKEKHDYVSLDEKNLKAKYKSNLINSSSFVNICIDYLNKDLDFNEKISTLFAKVAEYYYIDRIVAATSYLKLLYQFHDEKIEEANSYYDIVKQQEYIDSLGENHDYICNDTLNCDNKIASFYKDKGIRSLYQLTLFYKEHIIGYVSFEIMHDRRIWQRNEILQLGLLSKIICENIIRHSIESQLETLSYEDPLTKIFNITKFKQVIIDKDLNKLGSTVLSFDVVRFRYINEKYGYKFGDELLISISKVLNKLISKENVFCRLSDDKFVVLLQSKDKNDIIEFYESIRTMVIKELKEINTHFDFYLFGGAFIIDGKTDLIATIDKAGMAKKYAKHNQLKYLVFYDDKLQKLTEREKEIEGRMQYGIDNNEFLIYLQPCYSIKTKKICSFEALVRWNMDGKIIYPGSFIPIFEKNGFIDKLDFYVYEEVCKTISKWKDEGRIIYPISINVSRNHLLDVKFEERLNYILEKYNVEKKYIGIELTESLFVDNEIQVSPLINNLRKNGYKIYMDDFGVAYSTLNLLSRIQVDVIKLDKSFLDNNLNTTKEKIIVQYIIKMAKDLGISVLSEGVETQNQVDELTNMSCDYVQGYYFSKPQPINVIEEKYITSTSTKHIIN